MSVVNEVGTNMDDEPEPTWDEAVAAFNRAAPVELVRSPRQVTVVYQYANGTFTATSPDVRSFRVTGQSLHETRAGVREDLERFLDPAVKVVERFPPAEPGICTAATGWAWMKASPLNAIFEVSSSGTARTFVSSVQGPTHRVQTS